MPNRVFTWVLIAFVLVLMAGCGGTTSPDDNGDNNTDASNDAGNDENTPPVDGGDTDAETARLGSLVDGGDFTPGIITASRSSLTAGENATLTVALVDDDGAPLSDPVSVSFTSPCASDDLAELDPAVVDNSNGRISTTYTTRGCDGEDTITATTVVDGTTLQATVDLETETAPPGSILFDAAEPGALGIQGTGGTLPEQSTVSFIVTNTTGGPVPNQDVGFSLNTTVGGIELSNTQAATDADGRASTTVSSGTVATSVRVTAETMNDAGTTLTAQSNNLSITTGIPDNDSFTIGAQTLNIEGWNRNNETTEVTALLADRFNNPVPDGTTVAFQTEGGSIDPRCVTENGQCSVTFRSQNPRPADGRVTILATAIGEESFTDTNGNGIFDSSDEFPDGNDLAEAFRDDNENDNRDSNEPFVDFGPETQGDDNYSAASGSFTGVLCNSGCDSMDQNTTLNVRDSVVVVLSGSSLNVTVQPELIVLDDRIKTITVNVTGENRQVAPAGTTVAVDATQGDLVGASSVTQANTSASMAGDGGAGRFIFRLEPGAQAGNGVLLITVTTPSGVMSSGSASIQQRAAP